LYYLEYSFKYEQLKYSRVWDKLREDFSNEFIFKKDFFSQKRQEQFNFVERLLKNDSKTIQDIKTFRKQCKIYETNIDNFFKKVYTEDLDVICG